MSIVIVTGTGTDVGKTIVTAAIAALACAYGKQVAVLKPAQTGVVGAEAGDVDEVRRLVGDSPRLTTAELARFADPLAPATAARRSGRPAVTIDTIVTKARELEGDHDLVLIEGAGGLLVELDDNITLVDVAVQLGAPTLVVVAPGLGTLNATALTTEVMRHRGVACLGIVIGRWPAIPDLASQCNLVDLPRIAGVPLLGVLPDGLAASGTLVAVAQQSLAMELGGSSPWRMPDDGTPETGIPDDGERRRGAERQ